MTHHAKAIWFNETIEDEVKDVHIFLVKWISHQTDQQLNKCDKKNTGDSNYSEEVNFLEVNVQKMGLHAKY